jgi:hypothetical protein
MHDTHRQDAEKGVDKRPVVGCDRLDGHSPKKENDDQFNRRHLRD